MKREFLEQQVNQNMREADSLALVIRDFQIQNKSIALDQQTNSLVSMYSESVAKYMQAEIEYELARNQYSESSPIVLELLNKKNLLQQKMKDLENSSSSLQPKYVIQIDKNAAIVITTTSTARLGFDLIPAVRGASMISKLGISFNSSSFASSN